MTKTTYRRKNFLEAIQFEGTWKQEQLRAHILNHKQKAEKAHWECHKAFKLQSLPSDILSPARSNLLTLPKQCHQLGSEYLNHLVSVRYLIQTTILIQDELVSSSIYLPVNFIISFFLTVTDIPQCKYFHNPLLSWWTSKLFSFPDYHEQCSSEHGWTSVSVVGYNLLGMCPTVV